MTMKQPMVVLGLLLTGLAIYLYRPHSRFLLTMFPPKNLYNHIVEQPIALKDNTNVFSFILTHNYVGNYIVGIYVNKPPPFDTPIVSNAELSLSININEKVFVRKKFARWANNFGGPGKKESGVILGYYNVPNDVPFGLSAKAILSIDSPDQDFEKKYGDSEFFIRRVGDE